MEFQKQTGGAVQALPLAMLEVGTVITMMNAQNTLHAETDFASILVPMMILVHPMLYV